MRSGAKIWILMAVAALVVVVVLLVVFLPSATGPGGAPTLTPTCTETSGPTATGIGYPTPTATGAGYPTPTATGIGYPTPTATGIGYPTPTTTGIGYPTPTTPPTSTCTVFWNQSSVAVNSGSNFSLAVNITNVEYLATGQFDVIYNPDVLNVRIPFPTAGSINDILDRTASGDPAGGCGWQSVGSLSWAGIDIGYGNNIANSGCLRILWMNDWWWKSTYGSCDGGDGSGQCGDGWITVIRFRAINPGTSEIAFAGKKQVNQIVNSVPYEDYSYGDSVLVWGPNVQVTVVP